MEYTQLGRTGLRVSVAGLGCGGSSRLGLGQGRSEQEAAAIVRAAFDQGVTFFDTAMAYGTERAVGLALAELPRDEVVVATKSQVAADGRLFSAEQLRANLDASLGALALDHVDVYMLHAVRPEHYAHALELREALLPERDAGKIRHVGITETGPFDPGHVMLEQATRDPAWEVVMLAFHMMHQNARAKVLPQTIANGIGTLLMFAVRAIFSRPERLRQAMRELAATGQVPEALAARDEPLDFLVREHGASSLIDAAYRYVRHEPGVDVVLFGTGDPAHLKSNVASILRPPLPDMAQRRLRELFAHLEGVGLDLPTRG
jgi:aryl-alcohol dehydrogenase-like predicted oxidoreductase